MARTSTLIFIVSLVLLCCIALPLVQAKAQAQKDYYSILGVKRTATENQIKRAYHKVCFVFVLLKLVCFVGHLCF
jgi:preprotein translocase subunit Sec63